MGAQPRVDAVRALWDPNYLQTRYVFCVFHKLLDDAMWNDLVAFTDHNEQSPVKPPQGISRVGITPTVLTPNNSAKSFAKWHIISVPIIYSGAEENDTVGDAHLRDAKGYMSAHASAA